MIAAVYESLTFAITLLLTACCGIGLFIVCGGFDRLSERKTERLARRRVTRGHVAGPINYIPIGDRRRSPQRCFRLEHRLRHFAEFKAEIDGDDAA